jgi:hypothetical protein
LAQLLGQLLWRLSHPGADLPENLRARMICAACGLDEEQPRGDVFFGRLNRATGGTLVLGDDAGLLTLEGRGASGSCPWPLPVSIP